MMKKVLGKTGLKVTTMGFGGIPIQRVSEEESVEIVRRCYELGMNFFDTARAYTVSEERVGKALEDVRDKVIIATKSGQRTAEGIEEELAISLKNLRTDYIDIYQLHNLSTREQWDKVREPGGALEAVTKAKEEGKIHHISVTSHDPVLSLELVESGLFETLMIPFNYLTPKPAEKLFPLCRKHNVGIINMKPFGGGAFSNANIALKYVFNNPDVGVVIPGVMSIAEVEENWSIYEGDITLTKEELGLIEKDKVELGTNFCRACGYCQPCPQEIPITFLLRAEKQFLRRMGWRPGTAERMTEAIEKGETCIQCRVCESRCPYELPISELLPGICSRLRTHIANQTIP